MEPSKGAVNPHSYPFSSSLDVRSSDGIYVAVPHQNQQVLSGGTHTFGTSAASVAPELDSSSAAEAPPRVLLSSVPGTAPSMKLTLRSILLPLPWPFSELLRPGPFRDLLLDFEPGPSLLAEACGSSASCTCITHFNRSSIVEGLRKHRFHVALL